MPEGDKPATKLQALFDRRPCFNAIRRGFLECRGRDLVDFQKALDRTLVNSTHQFQTDALLIKLRAAVASVVDLRIDGCSAPPQNFVEDVWPYYLCALEHGSAGRSWWLSYDELLAVATITSVP